ncbi:YncE family protein [Nocardia sp. NPDC052566]|uniref:YncE family protein n=1 Tax=Nocardia sp. NPDC052566 TaxID=3364330 RepID=UPI0037C8EDCD
MSPNDQLAVLSQSGHTLSFFDLATRERIARIDVLPEGHELCFDPTTRLLYASHTYRSGHWLAHGEPGHEISVIDVDARTVIDVIDLSPEQAPHALQIDHAAGLLYVSVEQGPAGPGGLVAVDLSTYEVLHRISAHAAIPHWAVVTRDGTKGYTTNKRAPFVSVLDLRAAPSSRADRIRRIPIAGSEGLDLSPDGTRLFVATPIITVPPDPDAAYRIQVIDTRTDTAVCIIALPEMPSPIHVTNRNHLLVGMWRIDHGGNGRRFREGLLAAYDATTFEALAQIDIGIGPINICSTPDGANAFVSELQSGTVTIVDLDTYTVTAALAVDRGANLPRDRSIPNQGAHGMAYLPAN